MAERNQTEADVKGEDPTGLLEDEILDTIGGGGEEPQVTRHRRGGL